MNPSDKKRKASKQLQIKHLDHMLWLSTPLGKFLSSVKNQSKRVLAGKEIAPKNKLRSWVVRLPSSFLGYKRMGPAGFQTIVIAEDSDSALEKAADCDVWDVLDTPITSLEVFLKDPIEGKATSK